MTVNIDEFKGYLKIDKFNLDEELIRQPELLFAVAEAYEEAAARRDDLKEALAVVDAELDSDVRQEAEDNKQKVTEGGVTARIKTHPKHKKAFDRFLHARERAAQLQALKESFTSRGYSIRDLCELYIAKYFDDGSVQGTSATDRVSYETRREELAKRREGSKKFKEKKNSEG